MIIQSLAARFRPCLRAAYCRQHGVHSGNELHTTHGTMNQAVHSFKAYVQQTLIWSMWAMALLLTLLRGLTRWHSQRQIFADDCFIFGDILSLTALTAVITRLLPQFYLAGSYTAAVMQDPTTPMPLPPDVFLAKTQTSLKFMFSQTLLFWTTLWEGTLLRSRCQTKLQRVTDLWQPNFRFSSSSVVS
jgi:hypothetical protein